MLAPLVGVGIFAALAWRAVKIEHTAPVVAERRFTEVRARFTSGRPVVEIDDAGRVVRRTRPDAPTRSPIRRLRAMAWRAANQQLVSADTPFWFFRIKGPAARYALAGTGFDLERLQLTPTDLEQFGPALILDHISRDGSRLLVWTE